MVLLGTEIPLESIISKEIRGNIPRTILGDYRGIYIDFPLVCLVRSMFLRVKYLSFLIGLEPFFQFFLSQSVKVW